MRWPWWTRADRREVEEHRREIEDVKDRLDVIEQVDVIADALAVLQRNGGDS